MYATIDFPRFLAVSLIVLGTLSHTEAKYSGGAGTPDDPYQIATAADLIALGESPEDYSKQFVLTADVDLDPMLPGRRIFTKAVIAPHAGTGQWPFRGIAFTGVFDGNGNTISHLAIKGAGYLALFGQLASAEIKNLRLVDVSIDSSNGYVGGLTGYNHYGEVTNCSSAGTVSGANFVGGLVGYNLGRLHGCHSAGTTIGNEFVGGLVGINKGTVTQCYSTGAVIGNCVVGGLVGSNEGIVRDCYAKGPVAGQRWVGKTGALEESASIGGLAGSNFGSVICCYSTGVVSGDVSVGSLVGSGSYGVVTNCFWDVQTSNRGKRPGATGLTTPEMQMASTFLSAGWDFVGETANGTNEIWWILEGKDYPRFAWEFWASCPDPQTATTRVIQPFTLSWRGSEAATAHEVYLGKDREAVARATPQDQGVYRGQQPADITTYDPGALEYATTYYWRIDEVGEADSGVPWKGSVWSFTTADFVDVPHPSDGATKVVRSVILGWVPGGPGLQYDVYFGEDEAAVSDASPQSAGIYQGRRNADKPDYKPNRLEWGKTYYWRIDGVDGADPNSRWKGDVWSFTTVALITSRYPSNGATDVAHSPILSWVPGEPGLQYDVYFGADEETVANATPETLGVYQGRLAEGITTYELVDLELGKTYYWRLDGVDEADPESPWKGNVWGFTTANFIVVDDFESYTDEEGSRIYETWIDGWTNGTGSCVACWWWGPEITIVHGGHQSMPFDYNNAAPPYYSEAYRTWDVPQDWTVGGVSDLSLWIRGRPMPTNSPDNLYVALQDSTGRIGVAVHRDRTAVNVAKWTQWRIPMSTFTGAGVDLTAIKRIYIGVGDRANPQPSGTGSIWIDDIRVVPSAAVDANLVGWWTFNEGSGTVAHDYSGNICDGTVIDTTWAEGIHGGALDFTGGYVDIPAAAWSTIDTQATVAFWACARPGSAFVFGAFQNQSPMMSAVILMPGGYSFVCFDTGGTTADGYDRTYNVIDSAVYENTWAHWAFVKNAETGEQQIYLNGVLWHSGSGLTRTMTGVTKFTIGRHPYSGDSYLGLLDDFRLYDRALEAREIKILAAHLNACDPQPADGASDVPPDQDLTLTWLPGIGAAQHHVYFGDSAEAVGQGAAETDKGILTEPTFTPGELEPLATYYWRVDEIGVDGSVRMGEVWRFATCLVVDDFESHNDDDNRIYGTWIDGWINGTGSEVGYAVDPLMDWPAHSGQSSMPFAYNNANPPYYSEAYRTWDVAQDWLAHDADTLALYFLGRWRNDPGTLYVAIEDGAGQIGGASHPQAGAMQGTQWQIWHIPLVDLTTRGADITAVKRVYVGVGDRDNPEPGGTGRIYIDDIRLTKRVP